MACKFTSELGQAQIQEARRHPRRRGLTAEDFYGVTFVEHLEAETKLTIQMRVDLLMLVPDSQPWPTCLPSWTEQTWERVDVDRPWSRGMAEDWEDEWNPVTVLKSMVMLKLDMRVRMRTDRMCTPLDAASNLAPRVDWASRTPLESNRETLFQDAAVLMDLPIQYQERDGPMEKMPMAPFSDLVRVQGAKLRAAWEREWSSRGPLAPFYALPTEWWEATTTGWHETASWES